MGRRVLEWWVSCRLQFGQRVVRARVFLLGQSRTRWPCFPHSKHRPVFWYSSHSLSFVALRMTAEVSIALSSRGGRHGWGGARFPDPRQFWLLDPGLLPPGRRQTQPEVCLCPCPWVRLLKVPYSEWSDLVFKKIFCWHWTVALHCS